VDIDVSFSRPHQPLLARLGLTAPSTTACWEPHFVGQASFCSSWTCNENRDIVRTSSGTENIARIRASRLGSAQQCARVRAASAMPRRNYISSEVLGSRHSRRHNTASSGTLLDSCIPPWSRIHQTSLQVCHTSGNLALVSLARHMHPSSSLMPAPPAKLNAARPR